MTNPADIAEGNRQARDLSWVGPTEQLVAGIVAVLNGEMPGEIKVDEMPDKPGDFDLGEREAAILVHYRGSKYAAAATAGLVSQQRTPGLDIHLVVRGLKGRLGAYALTDLVTRCLQARSIAGATGFNLVSDSLASENDGIWRYVLSFACSVPIVAMRRTPDHQRSIL